MLNVSRARPHPTQSKASEKTIVIDDESDPDVDLSKSASKYIESKLYCSDVWILILLCFRGKKVKKDEVSDAEGDIFANRALQGQPSVLWYLCLFACILTFLCDDSSIMIMADIDYEELKEDMDYYDNYTNNFFKKYITQ